MASYARVLRQKCDFSRMYICMLCLRTFFSSRNSVWDFVAMPQICGRAGRFGRQFSKTGRQFFELVRLENSPAGQVAGSFLKLAGLKLSQPARAKSNIYIYEAEYIAGYPKPQDMLVFGTFFYIWMIFRVLTRYRRYKLRESHFGVSLRLLKSLVNMC